MTDVKLKKLCWDDDRDAVVAYRRSCLGAIVLDQQAIAADPARKVEALQDYVRSRGLRVLDTKGLESFLARLLWVQRAGVEGIAKTDEQLLCDMDWWLAPALHEIKNAAQLARLSVVECLLKSLPWAQRQQLEQLAPASLRLPTGRNQSLRYQVEGPPVLSAKITELYGLVDTPRLGGEPVLIEMLSPAGRPMQLTADLARFWAGSYREVQKEMKGRYPKHFWPDDPANAKATDRTKKRM